MNVSSVWCVAILLTFSVAGCANSPRERENIPWSLAQKPEERETLAVGRVIAIEQRTMQVSRVYDFQLIGEEESRDESKPDMTRELQAFIFQPFVALVVSPVMLTGHALGMYPEYEEAVVYSHVIRLSGSDESVIRDEFFSYKIGDCVALRSKPPIIVPAIPGQCE